MIRSWAYNRFGVLMGTSSRASCPRWPSLRGNSWPMITLFSSQGDFCATALKAIGDFVAAIIEQQTACQAQLARYFGKQEAAVKRLSRLLHNERLDPRLLADAVLLQALHQLPKHGTVRLAVDLTIEAD